MYESAIYVLNCVTAEFLNGKSIEIFNDLHTSWLLHNVYTCIELCSLKCN